MAMFIVTSRSGHGFICKYLLFRIPVRGVDRIPHLRGAYFRSRSTTRIPDDHPVVSQPLQEDQSATASTRMPPPTRHARQTGPVFLRISPSCPCRPTVAAPVMML